MDAGMGELHTGPKHQMSGTETESFFNLQDVPPGYQLKGEGDSGYLAQYNQAYTGWMRLATIGQLPN